MVDPPASQDIARRSFDVVRRGYEQQEVRGFLHEVSALVDRLQRSEVELRERAERAEAKLGVAEQPDESMLLEVLGAETTRVLTSAHEAAAEIRTKAEASVERIVAEATAEAARLRSTAAHESEELLSAARSESAALLEQARGELDRRTEEALAAVAHLREEGEAQADALRAEGEAVLARARAEADGLVEAAREQGRAMVAEAQGVREKVLRDLVARRKRARQQVEKLNAGRERLLQAYEVVRRTIDEATAELHVSLSDARLAANAAARRVDDEPDTSLEEIDAEVSAAGLLDLAPVEVDDRDDDLDDADELDGPSLLSGEVPVVGSAPPPSPEVDAALSIAGGSMEVGEPPAPSPHPPTGAPGDVPGAASLAAGDDRRARKSKRRKGFEGLSAGELDVVAPPLPGEGIRIIPAPTEPEEASEPMVSSDPVPAADPAPTLGGEPPSPDLEQDSSSDQLVPSQPVDSLPASPHAESPQEAADEATEAQVADLAVTDVAVSDVAVTDVAVTDVEKPDVEVRDVEVRDVEVMGSESATSSAEDVFARLRAESASVPALDAEAPFDVTVEADDLRRASEEDRRAGAAAAVEAVEERTDETAPATVDAEGPFADRAQAVGPLEKELSRVLKRALADEQNEVLDLLRRSKPKGVEDVLPPPEQHAARWATAAADALADAATAGAACLGGSPTAVTDLARELAESLTVPLRERIDRGFVASDGNVDDIADRVRALYREWRGQRLSDAASHYAAAAYAHGVFAAIDDGTKVCWVIDPSAGACPDCDDNVLAGAVVKGEEFPTGNTTAPAHPGCHCLVLASPT